MGGGSHLLLEAQALWLVKPSAEVSAKATLGPNTLTSSLSTFYGALGCVHVLPNRRSKFESCPCTRDFE